MKPKDHTGKRYGMLVGIVRDPQHPNRWIWKCDCGTVKSIITGNVVLGKQKSCGCLKPKGKTYQEIYRAANRKYAAKQEQIPFRVPKGEKQKYVDLAERKQISLGALIRKLLDEELEKEAEEQA